MNGAVFLATLGQRPEAVTMALDVLHLRYRYTEVGILHTDPVRSGIRDAFDSLNTELTRCPDFVVKHYEIKHLDGTPLIDIQSIHDGDAYLRGIVTVLKRYRSAFRPVHLLVSGGRKAMSIYATLAAATLFGENDKVWTVVVPHALMQDGLFHAPSGTHDSIRTIELPIQYPDLIPIKIASADVEQIVQRDTPTMRFSKKLTRTEREVSEALRQHPYYSNEELAGVLGRSAKTVENHLGHIYTKMIVHFNLEIEDNRKRQVLIDVLTGRV